MSAEGHDRHQDDIGAYLLHALEPDESERFEAHLATCPDCRDEVDRLRVAADALPRSVEPFTPPDSLKRSLMEAVAGEAPAGRTARVPLAERLGLARLFTLRPGLAVGAAAALLVVGGLVGFGVERLGSNGSSQRTLTAAVDNSRVPGASAKLVIRDGSAQLQVGGLPSPGRGDIYEVWLQRGQRVERTSLFSVAADGSGAAAIPDSLQGVDRVLVTRERGPFGALAPTTDPILSVKT